MRNSFGGSWHDGRRSVAVAVAAVALGVVACGDGDREASDKTDRDAIVAAVGELQEAVGDGDTDTICRRLTAGAGYEIGTAGHQGKTCLDNAAQLASAVRRRSHRQGWTTPRVVRLAVDGDRARTVVESSRRGVRGSEFRRSIEWVRRGGDWKLSAFIGATDGAAPAVPAGNGSARVASGRPGGRACPRVTFDPEYYRNGGCKLTVEARSLEVQVLTVAGPLRFAACNIAATLHVDDRGRILMIPIRFLGDGGCTDMTACPDAREGYSTKPWRGVITVADDGAVDARFAACLESCIGRFTGTFVMRTTRDGRRWRVSSSAGTAGVGIAGTWNSTSGSLRIDRRPGSRSAADRSSGEGPTVDTVARQR